MCLGAILITSVMQICLVYASLKVQLREKINTLRIQTKIAETFPEPVEAKHLFLLYTLHENKVLYIFFNKVKVLISKNIRNITTQFRRQSKKVELALFCKTFYDLKRRKIHKRS